MKTTIVFAVLLPFLAGCMADPPVMHETALVGGAAAAYPGMTVAWIPSENTKDIRGYIDQFNAFCLGMGPTILNDKVETDAAAALKREFGTVTRAETMDAAVALKPDLIAVVDAYVVLPKNIMSTARATIKTTFVDPSGRRVDEIDVESAKSVHEVTPFGLGVPRIKNGFLLTLDDAMTQFAAEIDRSPKLADFAKRRDSGEEVAASAPAPAKVYHSDVDRPTYADAEDDDAYALVIGVEKYQTLPDAQFALRDAEVMRRHLRALGYPERNILFLSNQRALKSSIQKYVESWLPEHVDAKSRVFVYFSGHGAPDISSKQAYLVPWDGDPKFLSDTAYPIKRLYAKLNALKARRVLVALDSCFSGAGGRSVLPQGLRPLVLRVDPGVSSMGKLVVLTASGPDEVTGTIDAQGHGLFTYYLLKSLNQTDGRGTVKTLYDSLRPKVEDAARDDDRDQTPQLLGTVADAATFVP